MDTEGMFSRYLHGFRFTGDLAKDAPALLRWHGKPGVATHICLVAARAEALAVRLGAYREEAVTAAYLHDISLIFSAEEMLDLARQAGLELLPEELQAHGLTHGKLSALMAERIFGVTNPTVLGAIRCHTTLRSGSTLLDRLLFVADKLAWAPHEAPYLAELESALAVSLERAVACFLDWSWRQNYRVVHPWLREACQEFCGDR